MSTAAAYLRVDCDSVKRHVEHSARNLRTSVLLIPPSSSANSGLAPLHVLSQAQETAS
jgi:hypothetical protein